MIAGIGTDLVDVAAFRRQLADPASSFASATFTAAERRACDSRPSGDPVPHLAARFAVKEAFIKAWSSSNFGAPPVLPHPDLKEIELTNDLHGRPALRLHGRVAAAVAATHGRPRLHVSLSHDGGFASAYVVLERLQGDHTATAIT